MRPRLLLVPTATELEWEGLRPDLEEWADVASFDLPGVGDEPRGPDFGTQTFAQRGLVELDRCGWDRCVVVGDEIGGATAAMVASMRPEAVAGLALGHACLSMRPDGDRPSLSPAGSAAAMQLVQTDYTTAIRQIFVSTDDSIIPRYLKRVPQEFLVSGFRTLLDERRDLGALIRAAECPLLLVGHQGCWLWTREGFEDAVAAFPEATTAIVIDKPAWSADFAGLLRKFAVEVWDG